MRKFTLTDKEAGQTLEKFLRKTLNSAPSSIIYKLFRKKDVKVNGHWEKEKYVLSAGDEISVYLTDAQFADFCKEKEIVPDNTILKWIVYEDDNILAVNKPRGVLVQRDDSASRSLDHMVLSYLYSRGEYDPKNTSFTPGPAHRIDRNTSGIVLFGKNEATLNYLFTLLRDHELIGKHYVTLVVGHADESGSVELPLKKDEKTNTVRVTPTKNGGRAAITRYHVLEYIGDYSLLDVTLITGRTHQIRVHMASIDHPVLGDAKYGNFEVNKAVEKEFGFHNQFLHAKTVSFGVLTKPLDYLSRKTITAPLPEEYEKLLSALRERN